MSGGGSEISENLSCSIEEEMGKVSLLGGCDQNSVLDGGNCMKSLILEKENKRIMRTGMKFPSPRLRMRMLQERMQSDLENRNLSV